MLCGLAPAEYTDPLMVVLREIAEGAKLAGSKQVQVSCSHDIFVDGVQTARQGAEFDMREVNSCRHYSVSELDQKQIVQRTLVALHRPIDEIPFRRMK